MVDLLPISSQERQVSLDLGWLIENQQISDQELCDYLVVETSQEIERLVFRFLQTPADRIAAVDQIIFTLLLTRRSYKSSISGKVWLYKLVLEECLKRTSHGQLKRGIDIRQVLKAIDTRLTGKDHFSPYLDTLTQVQRLNVILHYGQNLAAEEIALLLKINLDAVQSDLEQSQQILMAHQRSCVDCSSQISSLVIMETLLYEALQSNDHLMDTAHKNRADRARSLSGRLDRAKMIRRMRKWASKVVEVGILGMLFLVLGELAITHSWPSLPWIARPTASTVSRIATVSPTLQPGPTTTPILTAATMVAEKDLEEILTLALTSQSQWQTLWADVQLKTYKVENYSDGTGRLLDQSLRKQIWLSLPGSSRVVSGPALGSPDITYSILNDQMTGQNYESGQTIERSSSELIPDKDLQKIFSPIEMFTPGGQFTRIGSDTVAGRPAWVVNWSTNERTTYRYWLDQDYGVVLRRLEFDGGLFQPVVSEIVVTKVFYNANFPAEIFEPQRYRGIYYAHDFSGNPEINDLKSALQSWSPTSGKIPNAAIAPPVTDDFSAVRLSFINVPAGWMQRPSGPGVELFAEFKDLGRLRLDGKSIQACERSPDGSRIAYNSPPKVGSGDTALFVASLASIQSALPALAGGITSGDFSFSPDNRRLAFFGCEKASDFCGIFILELQSWELTRLTPLSFADYIDWSPDGHSIALVGKDDHSETNEKLSSANLLANELMALLHSWYFQVIDASSGDVVYKKMFDWFNLKAPIDSPTSSWGRPFKLPNAGVMGCIHPPEESIRH